MTLPIHCPECRKMIDAEARVCPHCGLLRPGQSWRRIIPGLWLLSSRSVVYDLIYLNVAIFVLAVGLLPLRTMSWQNPLSLVAPSDRALLLLGGSGALPLVGLHRWWTLLSAPYLSAGAFHLLFNVTALSQIGAAVAERYGPARLVLVYALGGAAGLVVSALAGVQVTVGSSAAVASLVGAVAYGAVRGEGRHASRVLRTVWPWLLGIFLFGGLVPELGNWVHAGGLAAGFVLGALFALQKTGESQLHRALARTCAIAAVAALSWGLGSGLFVRLLAPGAP